MILPTYDNLEQIVTEAQPPDSEWTAHQLRVQTIVHDLAKQHDTADDLIEAIRRRAVELVTEGESFSLAWLLDSAVVFVEDDPEEGTDADEG